MISRDFRAWAREALKGRWGAAVAVALVGSLLGGGLDLTASAGSGSTGEAAGLLNSIPRDVWAMLLTISVVSMLLAIVIGGAVQMGICTFNIKLMKREDARFSDLFSQFHRLWKGFCMQFMIGLFIMLWSLLFFIPGFIAAYRYAMVPYLLAEFPELSVMEAFRESKRLMKGNKWQLFCLHISFIGWVLLGMLSMGIGMLWVTPYQYAAEAAFYMDVTGRSGLRMQDGRNVWLEQ